MGKGSSSGTDSDWIFGGWNGQGLVMDGTWGITGCKAGQACPACLVALTGGLHPLRSAVQEETLSLFGLYINSELWFFYFY